MLEANIVSNEDVKKLTSAENQVTNLIISTSDLSEENIIKIANYKADNISFNIDNIEKENSKPNAYLEIFKKFVNSIQANTTLNSFSLTVETPYKVDEKANNTIYELLDNIKELLQKTHKVKNLSLNNIKLMSIDKWDEALKNLSSKGIAELTLKNCNLKRGFFVLPNAYRLFSGSGIKKLDLNENFIDQEYQGGKVKKRFLTIVAENINKASSALEELNLANNNLDNGSIDERIIFELLDKSKNPRCIIKNLNLSNNNITSIDYILLSFMQNNFNHNLECLNLRNNPLDPSLFFLNSTFMNRRNLYKYTTTRINFPTIILPSNFDLADFKHKIEIKDILPNLEERLTKEIPLQLAPEKVEEKTISETVMDIKSPESKVTSAGVSQTTNTNQDTEVNTNQEEKINLTQEFPQTTSELSDVTKQELTEINESFAKKIQSINTDDIYKDENKFEEVLRTIEKNTNDYLSQLKIQINKLISQKDEEQSHNIDQIKSDIEILKNGYISLFKMKYKVEQFFNLYNDDEKIKIKKYYTSTYRMLLEYFMGLSSVDSGIARRKGSWKDGLIDVGMFIFYLISSAVVIGTVPATMGGTLAALPFVLGLIYYEGNELSKHFREEAKEKEFDNAVQSFIQQHDSFMVIDMSLNMLALMLTYGYQNQILHTELKDISILASITGDQFKYQLQKNRLPDDKAFSSRAYNFSSLADKKRIECKGLEIFRKAGAACIYKNDQNYVIKYYNLKAIQLRSFRENRQDFHYGSNSETFGYIYFTSEDEFTRYQRLIKNCFRKKGTIHEYIADWEEVKTEVLDNAVIQNGYDIINKELTWEQVQEIEMGKHTTSATISNKQLVHRDSDSLKNKLANVNQEYRNIYQERLEKQEKALYTLITTLLSTPDLDSNSKLKKGLEEAKTILDYKPDSQREKIEAPIGVKPNVKKEKHATSSVINSPHSFHHKKKDEKILGEEAKSKQKLEAEKKENKSF